MNQLFIGVDPGKSGGIAVISNLGILTHVFKMPKTEHDINNLFTMIANSSSNVFGIIEKVHSMPGQGVASSFKFGMNYGLLRMAMVSNKIPFDQITPNSWQKHFGLSGKGNTKTEHKNILKGHAQQLYPDQKMTLAICDAVLLARYNYEINRTKPA